jgi:hypothetical protein
VNAHQHASPQAKVLISCSPLNLARARQQVCVSHSSLSYSPLNLARSNLPMFFCWDQSCGSGYSVRIESGSMGKKNEEKNALFFNFFNIFIDNNKWYLGNTGSTNYKYFFTLIGIDLLRQKLCLQIFLCGSGIRTRIGSGFKILWIRSEQKCCKYQGLNQSGSTTLVGTPAATHYWYIREKYFYRLRYLIS